MTTKTSNDKLNDILTKLDTLIEQNEFIKNENKKLRDLNEKLATDITEKVSKLEKSIEKKLVDLEGKLMGKVDAHKSHLSRNFKSYAETVSKKIETKNNDLNKKFDVVASAIENFENSEVISNIDTSLKEVKVNIESKIVKENESMVKKQKQHNVCIFNMPESNDEKDEENYKQDIIKLKSTLNGKIVIEKEDIKSIYRIGIKKNESRPRPLIIKFTNIEKRNEAIKLDDLVYCSNDIETRIYIQPDKTKKEVEQHRELVRQLKERRANGEENIVIRNGKIISLVPFRPDPQSLWG